MIVNVTESGWEVIYHRAHALLAAQIASQWPLDRAPRLYETIAAISHHDDLEREWEDEAKITEAGAPQDFTLDQGVSVKQLTHLVEGARYRSRWVALLISMHVCFLHQQQAKSSKDLARFLEKQQDLQQHWRKAMGVTPEEASHAYEFMRWCDRLSLILAQRKIPAAGRSLEITRGFENQRYDLQQIDAPHRVTVQPWPFAASEFVVTVEAQYLSDLKYNSSQALEMALREKAEVRDIQWTFAAS
ncbi:DUF3891 family protein [Lyngbya confervoides]|uniref:DUF3891 family protein n=1 Tax=Lyngbya confervoides BDU141951 TaxID=1574623 RepID=A0ABD4T4L8_9CYAN|nr:DUF3891 family protein [Lyngbya confervoides]MCM1983766.1 DUF3891 family protein [Lyngbya confervoides BDU141951]